MTVSPPASRLRRSLFAASRAPLAPDLVTAVLLFLLEGCALFLVELAVGMAGWGAQGNVADVDAASRSGVLHLEFMLAAALVLAAIAALRRARWTTGSQLLVASALTVMVLTSQHGYDQDHRPSPAPAISIGYAPRCYSGSGTCN